MSKLVFRWCLLCLLLTSGALFAVLTDWSITPTPPIGGGSYSLDSFVYSWALMLLNGGAGIIGLVIALNIGDRPASRRALSLSAVAIALLAITSLLHGGNLR